MTPAPQKRTWAGALVSLSPRPGSVPSFWLWWFDEGVLVSWEEFSSSPAPEQLVASVRARLARSGIPGRVVATGNALLVALREVSEVAARVEEGRAPECERLAHEVQRDYEAKLHARTAQRADEEDRKASPALRAGLARTQQFLEEQGQPPWNNEGRALLRALYRAKEQRGEKPDHWSQDSLLACLHASHSAGLSARVVQIAPQVLDAFFSWLGAKRHLAPLSALSLSDWCTENPDEIRGALRGGSRG